MAQCVGARVELEDEVDNYWDQNMGKLPLQRWLGVASHTELVRETRTTPFNRGRRILPEDLVDPRQEALLLSGLVSASQGQLFVRNRIYRRVFGENWINGRLTTEQSRQSRRATHRGMLAVGVPALVLIVYLVIQLLT
ncbi:MAG: hypothetical protein ACI9K5_004123 [Gammaproteobacteria bacterium]